MKALPLSLSMHVQFCHFLVICTIQPAQSAYCIVCSLTFCVSPHDAPDKTGLCSVFTERTYRTTTPDGISLIELLLAVCQSISSALLVIRSPHIVHLGSSAGWIFKPIRSAHLHSGTLLLRDVAKFNQDSTRSSARMLASPRNNDRRATLSLSQHRTFFFAPPCRCFFRIGWFARAHAGGAAINPQTSRSGDPRLDLAQHIPHVTSEPRPQEYGRNTDPNTSPEGL